MNYKRIKVTEPVLILDKKRCVDNINRMADKAKGCGIELRPHFKTHQSHIVGRWFRDAGVERITTSSIRMAEYFANDGWNDITVAFPFNPCDIERINYLSSKVKLNLLVSSPNVINNTAEFENKVFFYIEIDSGEHRTGIESEDEDSIKQIISGMGDHDNIEFEGFLTHAGNTYKAKNKAEILNVHNASLEKMKKLKMKNQIIQPALKISVGDTPSASTANNFEPADEIRPGNFVFYDWMQYKIGSCGLENIALIAACPIVSLYPERNEAVIHGGAVHLSKDNVTNEDGSLNYGIVVYLTENGWVLPDNEIYIKRMSQEHGVLHIPVSEMKYLKAGNAIGIIPIHSCLTADCMGRYVTPDGEEIRMMGKS